ncbi:MAG: hypothetical protein KCHDKBKB_01942 [Elusimicrobia bacterium]|nr:hypothetical protein [Elusimicrobiota bacterium]
MKSSEELDQRLARLQKWSERYDRLLEREARSIEALYLHAVQDWDKEKKETIESIALREIEIKTQLEQAGKDYSQAKYRLERDTQKTKEDRARLDEEFSEVEKKYEQELTRIQEEKTQLKISLERQKSALTDLYQEKMRHLAVTRAGLLREWQNIEIKVKGTKDKAQEEIKKLNEDSEQKLTQLKNNAESKRAGWSLALETIKKELGSLNQEREHLQERLANIKGEKEKELHEARLGMKVLREQLEVDKATLIEKAEVDQQQCEVEVVDLRNKVISGEKELQDLVLRHEQAKKQMEEAFQKEESLLKETVKTESERRDYEQKLFEQEKTSKEKELNRLKEEYEKKKWQWDNQIRSLMMQKAVRDSEYDAERLRVDREARTSLRSLEAKRDELKQRLADVKNRTAAVSANSEKEINLIKQRWQWRRDRLWALWQNRLDVLKKERISLQEQIEILSQKFLKETSHLREAENQDLKRTDEMQSFLLQMDENNKGQKKQREMQFELEKTKLFAQIKELETTISDWIDRMKMTHSEVLKESSGVGAQVGFLDKWYRQEEQETQVFLRAVQEALSVVEAIFESLGAKKAA